MRTEHKIAYAAAAAQAVICSVLIIAEKREARKANEKLQEARNRVNETLARMRAYNDISEKIKQGQYEGKPVDQAAVDYEFQVIANQTNRKK